MQYIHNCSDLSSEVTTMTQVAVSEGCQGWTLACRLGINDSGESISHSKYKRLSTSHEWKHDGYHKLANWWPLVQE